MRLLHFALVVLALLPVLVGAQEQKASEEGFLPMFSGTDLSGWHTSGQCWLVQDGVVHCTGESGSWLRSDLLYEDFVLRLEYKISPKGNSGVFLRAPMFGRQSQIGMEIQIGDDYGRNPGKGSAGALYSMVAPAKNMSRPAGEWNQVEITCRGKRVITVMNGEQLYDVNLDDEQLNASLADDFKASGRRRFGYIGLQNHGRPVWFRNVRIKPLPPEGYIPLFNGKDLQGWSGSTPGAWRVQDGLLVFEGKRESALRSQAAYGDFRLKLDYRLSKGAEGDIYVGPNERNAGARVHLADDAGAEPSVTSSGALYGILAPAKNTTKPTGGWNQLEITRQSGVLTANLNIIDLWSVTLSEHEALRKLPAECAIGLRGAAGRIELRNVYLKDLSAGR